MSAHPARTDITLHQCVPCEAMQSFANKQQPPFTVPHDPKQQAHAAFTLCHN